MTLIGVVGVGTPVAITNRPSQNPSTKPEVYLALWGLGLGLRLTLKNPLGAYIAPGETLKC